MRERLRRTVLEPGCGLPRVAVVGSSTTSGLVTSSRRSTSLPRKRAGEKSPTSTRSTLRNGRAAVACLMVTACNVTPSELSRYSRPAARASTPSRSRSDAERVRSTSALPAEEARKREPPTKTTSSRRRERLPSAPSRGVDARCSGDSGSEDACTYPPPRVCHEFRLGRSAKPDVNRTVASSRPRTSLSSTREGHIHPLIGPFGRRTGRQSAGIPRFALSARSWGERGRDCQSLGCRAAHHVPHVPWSARLVTCCVTRSVRTWRCAARRHERFRNSPATPRAGHDAALHAPGSPAALDSAIRLLNRLDRQVLETCWRRGGSPKRKVMG